MLRGLDIKADWLHIFCKYVEWPKPSPAGDQVYVVGVLGPNVFGKYLDDLAKKTANNKKIVVHHFPLVTDYKPCHVLFIAADDMTEKRLAQALEKTKDTPGILLVSDTEGFARKGVVFNLFKDGNVKVEMNPDAAKRAKLTLRSQWFNIPKIITVVKD